MQVVGESNAALMAAANAIDVQAEKGVAPSVVLGMIASGKRLTTVSHVLVPSWAELEPHAGTLNDVINVLNSEYTQRRKVMCRR